VFAHRMIFLSWLRRSL